MSLQNLFPIILTKEEEMMVAACYLLERAPQGNLFEREIQQKIVEALRLLRELPRVWAKELVLDILHRSEQTE